MGVAATQYSCTYPGDVCTMWIKVELSVFWQNAFFFPVILWQNLQTRNSRLFKHLAYVRNHVPYPQNYHKCDKIICAQWKESATHRYSRITLWPSQRGLGGGGGVLTCGRNMQSKYTYIVKNVSLFTGSYVLGLQPTASTESKLTLRRLMSYIYIYIYIYIWSTHSWCF